MKLYVRLKDVPELALLAPKQRRRVHDLCFQRYFLYAPPTRGSLTAYGLFLAISIFGGLLGSGGATSWGTLAPMVLATGLGLLVVRMVAIPGLRPFYKKYIESGL